MYVQSYMKQSGKFSSPTDPHWNLLLNVSIQRSFTTLIITFSIIYIFLVSHHVYSLAATSFWIVIFVTS